MLESGSLAPAGAAAFGSVTPVLGFSTIAAGVVLSLGSTTLEV